MSLVIGSRLALIWPGNLHYIPLADAHHHYQYLCHAVVPQLYHEERFHGEHLN